MLFSALKRKMPIRLNADQFICLLALMEAKRYTQHTQLAKEVSISFYNKI